jgi:hypothetical protein
MKKFLVLLTFWCAAITANASLITIDIEDKAYGLDDTLTANIYVSELNNGFQQLVSAFSFNLLTQDSLLTFQQATFGIMLDVDMFTFFPSDTVVDNSALTSLFISEFSYADGVDLLAAQGSSDNFLLASIDFKVAGLGLADFSLTSVLLGNELGGAHQPLKTEGASVQLGNQVSVPEPSTMAIFALAIMLLMSSRLRRS